MSGLILTANFAISLRVSLAESITFRSMPLAWGFFKADLQGYCSALLRWSISYSPAYTLLWFVVNVYTGRSDR